MKKEDPIQPAIREEILKRLAAAEREHDVRILYCCESGSRAWGFPSPDSDHDVRFIYVRPRDWYLAFDVERQRDVIEYPIVDEVDCGGWDLRKALYLFTRTNGALLEWLRSPIRYIERGTLAADLREFADSAHDEVALSYHYLATARHNMRELSNADQVRLKRYFYVLRPLLAIRWIQEGHGIPPIEFQSLVERVAPSAIRDDLAELLELKRSTPEIGRGPSRPVLNEFIQGELARHGDTFPRRDRPERLTKKETTDRLNDLFRSVLTDESLFGDLDE